MSIMRPLQDFWVNLRSVDLDVNLATTSHTFCVHEKAQIIQVNCFYENVATDGSNMVSAIMVNDVASGSTVQHTDGLAIDAVEALTPSADVFVDPGDYVTLRANGNQTAGLAARISLVFRRV